MEKLPLCTRWVKCSVKCGNYLKKNTIYLVLIVLSAPQSVALTSFPVGEFPNTEETPLSTCLYNVQRAQLKSHIKMGNYSNFIRNIAPKVLFSN